MKVPTLLAYLTALPLLAHHVPAGQPAPTSQPASRAVASAALHLLALDRYFTGSHIERPPLRRIRSERTLRPLLLQWNALIENTGDFDGLHLSIMLAECFGASMPATSLPVGTWTYVDERGNLLPQRFICALPFDNGVALVATEDGWGLIDETGRWVRPIPCDLAQPFSDGLAAVQKGELWGFINHKGDLVIPHKFRQVGFFSEGRCSVWPPFNENERNTRKNQGGYIESSGKAIIEPRTANICNLHPFADGLAMVRGMEGNHPRYVDHNGKVVLELWKLKLDGTWTFREERARVTSNGNAGFIDRTGKLVIPPKFADALDFSEGAALASSDEKDWGYIDRDGNWMLPPKYVDVQVLATRPFHSGLARVRTRDGWNGFIDRAGKPVFAIKAHQEVDNFEDDVAFFVEYEDQTEELKWGYIHRSGKPLVTRTQRIPREQNREQRELSPRHPPATSP